MKHAVVCHGSRMFPAEGAVRGQGWPVLLSGHSDCAPSCCSQQSTSIARFPSASHQLNPPTGAPPPPPRTGGGAGAARPGPPPVAPGHLHLQVHSRPHQEARAPLLSALRWAPQLKADVRRMPVSHPAAAAQSQSAAWRRHASGGRVTSAHTQLFIQHLSTGPPLSVRHMLQHLPC